MHKKIKTSIAIAIISFLALISGVGIWSMDKNVSNKKNFELLNTSKTEEKIDKTTEIINSKEIETPADLNTNNIEEQPTSLNPINEPTKEKSLVETPQTPPPVGKIKCKLKFDDEVKDLDSNEVIVNWNCTDYLGWECTLKRSQQDEKVFAKLPSGKEKMRCNTGSYRKIYNAVVPDPGLTWYVIKCTSREGRIEKFEEIYRNYR